MERIQSIDGVELPSYHLSIVRLDKYPALVEMSLRVCDERDIPTKLITITYKNETIESYE